MTEQRNVSVKSLIRWAAAIAGIGLVVALFVFNVSQPKSSANEDYEPWSEAMVMGSLDAPNRMIEYTDYFCSFCADLHKAMGDEFKKTYIDNGKLSFETRIVNLLSGVSVNTVKGNQAAFCSAEQDKYWEYSHEIITRIDNDYFSKGIGVKNVANPVKISQLDDEYFVEPARVVGLDVSRFQDCIGGDLYLDEIENNSNRAIQLGVNGLPSIKVNSYTASGFGGGGYEELKLILKAGGVE